MSTLSATGLLLISLFPAHAATTLQLVARTDWENAFGVAPGSDFLDSTPVFLNENRICVALNATDFEACAALWCGDGSGPGVLVARGEDDDLFANPSPTRDGRLVFERVSLGGFSHGVVLVDPARKSMDALLKPGDVPGVSALFTSEPALSTDGMLLFRVKDERLDTAVVLRDFAGGYRYLARSTAIDPTSVDAFLFSPSLNARGEVALKVRVGADTGEGRRDEIRLYDTAGAAVAIAIDADGEPSSTFASFDNSVALDDEGRVAFVASLVTGGRCLGIAGRERVGACALSEGDRLDSGDVVASLDPFAPESSGAGRFVARVRLVGGKAAIVEVDGERAEARVLVREGDTVETDLGPAVIARLTDDALPFSGGIAADSRTGAVAFASFLRRSDTGVSVGLGLVRLTR